MSGAKGKTRQGHTLRYQWATAAVAAKTPDTKRRSRRVGGEAWERRSEVSEESRVGEGVPLASKWSRKKIVTINPGKKAGEKEFHWPQTKQRSRKKKGTDNNWGKYSGKYSSINRLEAILISVHGSHKMEEKGGKKKINPRKCEKNITRVCLSIWSYICDYKSLFGTLTFLRPWEGVIEMS